MFVYPLHEKLPLFISLARLDRPIGIYLLLWPVLWALWFAANGFPDLDILIIFILGTVLTRSAGCIVNDYADRHLDAHVDRTKQRPLATGQLNSTEALVGAAVLMLLAFLLVLFTNKLTVLLSFIALILAVIYPFTKRFTHWPQLFLGLAFAFAIPMAFAAQINSVPPLAWLLFLSAVLWAIAYDTLYAMADKQFDIKMGMKSTAILFAKWAGKHDITLVLLLHFSVLAILFVVGLQTDRHAAFYSGLFAAAFFAVYQNKLACSREPAQFIAAFFNNHYLGMTVFIGIVLDFLLFPAGTT